jgi:cyclophilin family peptidyl-prolyl cis-trans isomerase
MLAETRLWDIDMDGYRMMLAGLAAACVTGAVTATEVAICTDQGRAVLELADAESPQHVANFLRYVDMGFYTGTVFHRAVPGFVVQGGGVDRQLRPRSTLAPIANESANGLRNARGTVAAARTDDPNSATAQFFVNLEDNRQLDSGREPGFTVFGRVKEGIAMFDALSRLPTGAAGPFRADVPSPLVAIKSIARLDEAALAQWPAERREAALKSEIAAAAGEQRSADALRLLGHYRAICGVDDPELALIEARMALAADDRRRALFALEELLATTDAAHPARVTADELYREALPEAQPAGAQRVGACEPPAPPALPDATTASREDMLAAQTQVREFVASAESHLTCLAQIIDDDERSADDRNAAVSEHNRTVAVMEQLASAFNEQVRIFRDRG